MPYRKMKCLCNCILYTMEHCIALWMFSGPCCCRSWITHTYKCTHFIGIVMYIYPYVCSYIWIFEKPIVKHLSDLYENVNHVNGKCKLWHKWHFRYHNIQIAQTHAQWVLRKNNGHMPPLTIIHFVILENPWCACVCVFACDT